MPPVTLEGDTLGEKHKSFNKLVHDAVINKQTDLPKIDYEETDVQNLLKINIACQTKNVDYIIKVLKCDDMLYVSTAIRHSTWLINEKEYAHIINPEYLDTQLFPHMLTQAINKLLLNIRLHLKDEERVEAFYTYFKDVYGFVKAKKWLLNCSIPFIENEVQKERHISFKIYKRLCKRSIKFLPYYNKVESRNYWRSLNGVQFLIKSHTQEFLDVLKNTKDYCGQPTFGKKHTEIILKKCPEIIFDNFKDYVDCVDMSMVAKYLKKDEINNFLFKYANMEPVNHIFNHSNIKPFIMNMPKEDRFEFVKKIYIERVDSKDANNDGQTLCCAESARLTSSLKTYEWYQYAPFDVALKELKKLIRADSSPNERCAMLSVLITCAKKQLQNAKIVLQYYYEMHRNEPFKFKIQFVNNVIRNMSTHEFDSETWSILDKLFHSLEVYIESNNDVQLCLQAIIVYKVLRNESIPDIIESKSKFDTFEKFRSKLNENQKDRLFKYLITSISNKINNKTIVSETDLEDTKNLVTNVLELLKCWDKDVEEYTLIRNTIQEMIKIKKQNSWQTSLSSLYDFNKSWRKHLFEESMALCPSERVCLNALKYEPQLLERHSDEINALRSNENVVLRQLLRKLRVYWPHSLAQQWTEAYFNNLDKGTGQKALIKGLLVLLPQNQLIDLAQKYVPKDPKIDWSEIDQSELSLCKNLALNLYIARPLTSLGVVLWYAKGDYLQYAVPSLNAILHNLSKVQSRAHIPNLLEAPVSLQKYGLKLAFMKLEYKELTSLFSDVWHTTNNLTIRAHIFIYTYNLLCKIKDPTHVKELWKLLNTFINNLTANENKEIYNKLGNAEKVHVCIQGDFFMKSYTFLTSLPPAVNCDSQKDNLLKLAPNIMDQLDADFVMTKIVSPVEQTLIIPSSQYINIMSSFTLHGNTEEEQCNRFRKVLVPALEHALTMWELVKNERYVVKENIDALLRILTWDFRKYLTKKKIIIPVKLFSEIKSFIEQKMPIQEVYITYTCWKLITEYVNLVSGHENIFCNAKLDNMLLSEIMHNWLPDYAEKVWEELHMKLSPKLGPIIVKHLKEDIQKYFSSICWLFSDALEKMFSYLSYNRCLMKLETLKYMVVDEDFIPSYIVVCNEMPKYGDGEEEKKRIEIRKILAAHPSQEVKMHYHKAFTDYFQAFLY